MNLGWVTDKELSSLRTKMLADVSWPAFDVAAIEFPDDDEPLGIGHSYWWWTGSEDPMFLAGKLHDVEYYLHQHGFDMGKTSKEADDRFLKWMTTLTNQQTNWYLKLIMKLQRPVYYNIARAWGRLYW